MTSVTYYVFCPAQRCNDANERLYGVRMDAKEIILHDKVAPPTAAEELLAVLNKRSLKNLSAALHQR